MGAKEKFTLMRLPLFEKFAYDEMEIVGNIVSTYQFHAEEVLFQEGSHGGSMYFVVDGTLEVIRNNEEGKPVLIATLMPGQSVGEMAIIEGIVRSATVKAKTDGSLITLKREDFDTLLEEHPKIGVKFLKGISCLLSKNLRKMSVEIINLMLPIV